GYVGGDGPKFPAILGGSSVLKGKSVDVRRPAAQENHRDGLGGLAGSAVFLRSQPQQVGQGQPGAQGADLEEIAAADTVAERLAGTPESQHENAPKAGPIHTLPKRVRWQRGTCNEKLALDRPSPDSLIRKPRNHHRSICAVIIPCPARRRKPD